ncbi:putative nucleotidyltransferase, ribonuclease H [Tanacetum coccineum]
MLILDSMMNDEIRESVHYMTYLALSTNTEANIPKVGKGKGLMGKKKTDTDVHKEKKKDTMKKNDVVLQKKNSFTAADNILLDADEAVKLAESISLTEEHEHWSKRRRIQTWKMSKRRNSRPGQYIEELKENIFYGKENEDPHEHIYNIIDIIDLFHSPGVARDQDREPGILPSFAENNLKGLAHAITTRSGLNYKPPKNPLEDNSDSQDKPVTKETITKNDEEHKHSIYRGIRTNAKFMKDHLAKKGKAKETSKITLNERCSAVPLNKIPLKEKDLGSFTITCVIRKIGINKALADLGASISIMPHSMFARLDLGELKPTRMCIELANKSTQYPRGIAKNVKINKFIFPVDFVVLDMEEDHKIRIILGRPFLATAHTMINVFNKKITFEVGNETITFDIEKSMKFSTLEDDTYLSIDMVDISILDNVQEILPSNTLDSFLFKPDDWQPNDFIKPTLFASSTSEAEEQLPKLKELPSHLEYAFLNDNQEFLVIILSLFSPQEKDLLLQVLSKHKAVLALKASAYHFAKIVKLLDAGLIYAISDSLWVSPIHVVPKRRDDRNNKQEYGACSN